jgi:hypothetical protein
MTALKWFLIMTTIISILLFLYGANYYNPVVGWVGVSLLAASFVGFLILYVHNELAKRDQKS